MSGNLTYESSLCTIGIEDRGVSILTSEQDTAKRIPVSLSRYTWRPSDKIAGHLPPNFSLVMECITDAAGIRKFWPAEGVDGFVLRASLGGYAVLRYFRHLNAAQRFSYNIMRLLYQLAPRLREHFGRSFRRGQDWRIARSGDFGDGNAFVLPTVNVFGAEGECGAGSPRQLIETGRMHAVERGLTKLDEATCLRLGLLETARRDPVLLGGADDVETKKIVRFAVFDLGPNPSLLNVTLIEQVEELLLKAIERHIEDDNEAFNAWFFSGLDNIVHQIAKKKRPGGKIPRDGVRQAVLEIVLRAFDYIAQCVDLMMREFRRTLRLVPESDECALFDMLYVKQSYSGGWPLIMLRNRFDFLKDIVLEMLERPRDPALPGVLLRMLQYYGEMASKRREVDRLNKRKPCRRNADNQTVKTLELKFNPSVIKSPKPELSEFEDIVGEILTIRNVVCRCGELQQWAATLDEANTNDESVAIDARCKKCDSLLSVTVSRQEFRRIGNKQKDAGNDGSF